MKKHFKLTIFLATLVVFILGATFLITNFNNTAGIRTLKLVNGMPTYYFVEGDRILAERTGSLLTWFYYDETGVSGMRYNGTDYVFEKNILGDIVGVYTTTGTLVGTYTYDAWGRILSQTNHSAVNANPFRYRGYYYDSETKLYYLNTRYYDPEIGRFINADIPTIKWKNFT